jgi:diguanylate cyclase (GGDEF)-like protein
LSRLLERLREPVALDGGDSAEVTASIGVAICPDDAVTAQALLRCADEAMYSAKAGGHGRWRFHESTA